MSNVTTLAFRNIVRQTAKIEGVHIVGSWTDTVSLDAEKRIVTFRLHNRNDAFLNRLKNMITLIGADLKKHDLRETKNGYIKCTCVITHPRFN